MTIPKDPIGDLWDKKDYHFLLSLQPLQRNPNLPSATRDFLNFLSTTSNLHIIHKTFTLIYPSINKFKYMTHPRYITNF